jgi:hypothetical protein
MQKANISPPQFDVVIVDFATFSMRVHSSEIRGFIDNGDPKTHSLWILRIAKHYSISIVSSVTDNFIRANSLCLTTSVHSREDIIHTFWITGERYVGLLKSLATKSTIRSTKLNNFSNAW